MLNRHSTIPFVSVASLVLLAAAMVGGAAATHVAASPADSVMVDDTIIRYSGNRTWRGSVGSTIEVTYMQSGREWTATGTLVMADRFRVKLETVDGGSSTTLTILPNDIISIKSVAASTNPVKSGPKMASADAGSDSKEDDSKAAADDPSAPGVFVLPLEGQVGVQFRHDEIEAIAEHADKFGPHQTIVLMIDSGGGLVTEGDKIHDSLMEIKKRHKVVAWIKEAISGAAFTAMHCDEIYFMNAGALGSITMFAGSQSAQGTQLAAWIEKVGQVSEAGGRNGHVGKCMVHSSLLCSYDIDPVTGDITFHENLDGEHILSDSKSNLTLNASNALHCGFSDGTADTTDELAEQMGLPRWNEKSDYGRKLAGKWKDTCEKARYEVPKLYRQMEYKGSGSGDAMVMLGAQINNLQKIIRWYDRCYPVVVYDLGLPGDPEPLKRQLAEMRKQLADMRRNGN